jgi:hypothetical protein
VVDMEGRVCLVAFLAPFPRSVILIILELSIQLNHGSPGWAGHDDACARHATKHT